MYGSRLSEREAELALLSAVQVLLKNMQVVIGMASPRESFK